MVYVEATSSFQYPSLTVCADLSWAGFPCLPRHSPYSVNVESTTAEASLTMYPNFDFVQKGEVRVLFENFYSSSFDNVRDINVYLPAQYLENPIKRKMNILVVLVNTTYIYKCIHIFIEFSLTCINTYTASAMYAIGW
jgi:hypothetical protein